MDYGQGPNKTGQPSPMLHGIDLGQRAPELTSFDRLARLEQKIDVATSNSYGNGLELLDLQKQIAGITESQGRLLARLDDLAADIHKRFNGEQERIDEMRNTLDEHVTGRYQDIDTKLNAALKGVSDGVALGFADLLKALGDVTVLICDIEKSYAEQTKEFNRKLALAMLAAPKKGFRSKPPRRAKKKR